jgi:hypothetical protein
MYQFPRTGVSQSLLVYDDSVAWLAGLADTLVSDVADVRPVAWGHAAVQSFLDAQFDDRPFAFLLIEDDHVYVGEDAVERLGQRGGLPDAASRVLKRAYPPFSAPIGRLVHGREPADLHGTFPLVEDARAHLDSLRSHEIPVVSE